MRRKRLKPHTQRPGKVTAGDVLEVDRAGHKVLATVVENRGQQVWCFDRHGEAVLAEKHDGRWRCVL